jgi:hypothetical protein
MKTMDKVSAVMVCITLGCLAFQVTDQAQDSVSKSSTVGKQSMGTSVVPPVTYSGILPCVACAGREFTLSLRPDGLYLLRQVYLSKEKGKNKTLVEQGSWRSTTDGGRLSLWGGIEMHQQLVVRDADTLRCIFARENLWTSARIIVITSGILPKPLRRHVVVLVDQVGIQLPHLLPEKIKPFARG